MLIIRNLVKIITRYYKYVIIVTIILNICFIRINFLFSELYLNEQNKQINIFGNLFLKIKNRMFIKFLNLNFLGKSDLFIYIYLS